MGFIFSLHCASCTGPTKTPHRTAPDPKILGDGVDQTPQRTGDTDTLFQAEARLDAKATNFKFGRYIHGVHANKSPLKIWEKRERGRVQRLPEFFEYPLLSQGWVKL